MLSACHFRINILGGNYTVAFTAELGMPDAYINEQQVCAGELGSVTLIPKSKMIFEKSPVLSVTFVKSHTVTNRV